MAKISNLVHQTATTTGTGNFTLAAVNGKRSFNTAFSTGGTNVFYYFISNQSAAEWEVGTGHMLDSTTLVRDTVLSSSNSNNAVSFSAGTKDVTNDMPSVTSTDNATVRFDGTTGEIQSSALLIADTTGGVSRVGGGGIPIEGTNTNDSAAAGYVGEIIESTLPIGSAISLTTGTTADVTSITITAGDWDVWGTVGQIISVAGTSTRAAINTTSATLPSSPGAGATFLLQVSLSGSQILPAGMRRYSVDTSTTVYLVTQQTFASGTVTAFGYLAARRVR